MEPLLNLLIYLLIGGVIIWAISLVLGLFPIPANIRMVTVVIVALIALLYILRALGLFVF